METSFADWFGIVSLRPTAEQLQKRSAALETIAGAAKRSALLNLVRVAKNRNADFTPLSDAARASDESFQTHQCEPELRVLAAAAIAEILKKPSKRANAIALATAASSFGGTQGDALFKRVLEHAAQFLADEAVRVRTLESPVVTAKGIDVADSLKKFTDGMGATPQGVAQHVKTLVEDVTKTYAKAILDLSTIADGLREESNMVWWVFAAHSRQLEKAYRSIGLPATCIHGPVDLASMTNLIPGPRSALAFLDRVLAQVDDSTKLVSVADAVNATDRQWRVDWVKPYADVDLRELAPVLQAGAKSLETDSPSDWLSAFAKSTGITDAKLAPPLLAMQVYQEALLVRAVEQVKA